MAQWEVDRALEQLARADADVADRARRAYAVLTGRHDDISQFSLQEFLWGELPRMHEFDAGEAERTAAAFGRLLELLDMPRYAQMCTAPITRQVLAAHTKGEAAGFAAYRAARSASEVIPPDVPELEWAQDMGTMERRAFGGAAAMLELAIEAGELRPGAPNWRATQRKLISRFLATPRAELNDASYLERIDEERRGGKRAADDY